MKRLSLISLVLLLATVTVLQAADHFTGTWKLNLAKSTYSPGMPPKSQTTKLESVKGSLREIVDHVNADGTMTHWDYTAMYDGKDYAITGDPDRDHASVKKVDDFTLEVVNKKAGKVTKKCGVLITHGGNFTWITYTPGFVGSPSTMACWNPRPSGFEVHFWQ